MGVNFYYIDYVDKKPEWNVNSVNYLYLMIDRIHRYAEGKNGNKYLNIADTVRNNEVLKNMVKCLVELNIISTKLMKVMENMTKTT